MTAWFIVLFFLQETIKIKEVKRIKNTGFMIGVYILDSYYKPKVASMARLSGIDRFQGLNLPNDLPSNHPGGFKRNHPSYREAFSRASSFT
jgi:hypothetical protein